MKRLPLWLWMLFALCSQSIMGQETVKTLYEDYTPVTMRYWFDKDYATATELPYASGTTAIDINDLTAGFHTLHYQVIDNHGASTGVRFCTFFIPERSMKTLDRDYHFATIRYWFDNDMATLKSETWTDGAQVLNLSYLSEGEHTMHYQLITADGQVSPVHTTTVNRWLYDIYVCQWTEYGDSLVTNDKLFAQRPDLKLHYLLDDTNVRGHLTVDEGTTLSLGKYIQTANWGMQHNSSMYAKTGEDYYHPTTLLNMGGHMRADSVMVKQRLYRDRWHYLSLPFNARVSDIGVPIGTYYALRGYDGETRALGEMTDTWTNLRKDDQMEAGRGYIVQLTRESSDKTAELTFKAINDTKKNDIFTTTDVVIALEEHKAEFSHNRSWNLVGNPYPSFYDSRYIDHDGIIIVWNGNGYTAYSLTDDSYILMPFEAFFIQKPLQANVLVFGKDGRQHSNEVLPRAARRRKAKTLENRDILNFVLTSVASDLKSDAIEYKDLQSETPQDRSRVVINEHASMSYEQDKDAPKFMAERPQAPQLFSVESGVQYAINERPMGDGQIVFSLYTPSDGEYRFSLVGNAFKRYDKATVLDTKTGSIWNLADGDYVFNATEGMNNARLVVSLNGETTAITQINAYGDGEIKVIDGQLVFSFMREKHIKVFGLDGRILFNDAVSHASIKVSHGIYLVEVDGKTTKIMVK